MNVGVEMMSRVSEIGEEKGRKSANHTRPRKGVSKGR